MYKKLTLRGTALLVLIHDRNTALCVEWLLKLCDRKGNLHCSTVSHKIQRSVFQDDVFSGSGVTHVRIEQFHEV